MLHTQGPWFVDGESGNPGESEAISSAGRVVAWSASTYNEEDDSDEVTDEDRANARLIAAAPELLAALRQCLPIVDAYRRAFGGDGDVSASYARSVIAKVEVAQ